MVWDCCSIFQKDAAPQMLQTLAQEVQLMVNGQSEVSLEEGVDTIKHLTTEQGEYS